MKIAIGGDVFLGGDLVNCRGGELIIHPVFNAADARIVNLEQAISDDGSPQEKSTLYTNSAATHFLVDLNITAVGIANNHIHDMGLSGIQETIKHIRNSGVSSFGAGENLENASCPYWVTEDIAVLGYCDFNRPYLNKIAVASETGPGVVPLRLNQILADLDRLPDGKKAILFFHWGREHVFFPPWDDIELARRLLLDDRVLIIAGMHSHVIQGCVSINGKRAYMSIGNLLFPNFFITPPTQIIYPLNPGVDFASTRRYHTVYGLTYKKWRKVNRNSLLIEYNTATGTVTHHPSLQDDYIPLVQPAPKLAALKVKFLVMTLSLLYRLPRPGYLVLEFIDKHLSEITLRAHIILFALRQKGIKFVVRKVLMRVTGINSHDINKDS